ncbi:unnamed protein product [Rotaria sordida]|uniref:Uncharacterized protein n=1 Tax=Rotaria sordida TaxID=392033 RepID=A0A818ZW80_9BILA|nr:unnamed protein product [Rotaria sordida]
MSDIDSLLDQALAQQQNLYNLLSSSNSIQMHSIDLLFSPPICQQELNYLSLLSNDVQMHNSNLLPGLPINQQNTRCSSMVAHKSDASSSENVFKLLLNAKTDY